MAKDRINSIVIRENGLEWSEVSATSRGQHHVLRSGFESFSSAVDGEEIETPVEVLAQKAPAATLPFKGAVTLGVETAHVLARVVRLPHAEPDEMASMAELQADKFCPFPVDVMSVSHEVLQQGDGEDVVLVCAVKDSILEEARTALQPLGMHIARVDAVALGWWQLLQQAQKIPDSGRHVFILLSQPCVQLIAVDNGIPAAFRALPVDPDGGADVLAKEVSEAIQYTLMGMEMDHGPRAEYGVTLWYDGEEPPHGLANALEPLIDTTPSLERMDELGSAADGVAARSLRPQQRLDLTPATWRREEENVRFKRRLLTGAGAVVGVWVLLVGSVIGLFAYERQQLEILNGQRDLWGQQAAEVRELRRRVITIQTYTNQTHSALECLREVSARQTPGVELDSLTYVKGDGLRLSGSATAVSLVYDFQKRLHGSELFKNSELDRVRLNPRTGRQEFDLIVQLPGGES